MCGGWAVTFCLPWRKGSTAQTSTHLLVLAYRYWWMITVCNREAWRKEQSPYSKELPHFSAGELMFSAIAEGHGDRPGRAQDMTWPSCMHSRAYVTLPCSPPREGDRSQSSTERRTQEAQERRTGVHLWNCFHRVSKLISHTARAQPLCHEGVFLLNLLISGPTIASPTATSWAKQGERGAPLGTGGHHTANTCSWASHPRVLYR